MEPGRSTTMKVSWSWEEWQARRAAVRSVTSRVGPDCRRKESSSDKRLRNAFGGKRAP
jgi:hypothetical protein